jgi:hypothetical protein
MSIRGTSLVTAIVLLAACRADQQSDAGDRGAPPVSSAAPESTTEPDSRAAGSVCPHPARPCPGFRENDLSFVLPRDGVAREHDESEEFLAVIVASGPACSIPEPLRAEVQAGFPDRKVFSHRFECDGDSENNVSYTGADERLGFLAVYAGRSRSEGDSVLASILAVGSWPDANLRRMHVRYVHP